MLKVLLILTFALVQLEVLPAYADAPSEELQLLQLVNELRAEFGVAPLAMNAQLTQASQFHSDYMKTANGLTTHYGPPPGNSSPFDRMTQFGMGNYTYAAENVACGYADAIRTFRQWAFSPGHLKNMTSKNFDLTGIARAGNGNQLCGYYWTQNFYSSQDTSLRPLPRTFTIEELTALVNRIAPQPTHSKRP